MRERLLASTSAPWR